MNRAAVTSLVLAVAMAVCPHGTKAQQARTIRGTVTAAETGAPLARATVSVVGTPLSALTDGAGRYAMAGVPAGPLRVRARMLGYAPADTGVVVAESQDTVIDLQLKAQAIELEAVVAVGYGTQRRRDLTGAVTSINADQAQSASLRSVDQALQGRAAGVLVVQNNGAPGSSPTVRIRGGNSFIGGNDPLYVVDGLPVGGSALTAVNPDDVESMEVLKDAAATAIYGARGANGVVLITTRQGRRSEHRMHVESSIGVRQV